MKRNQPFQSVDTFLATAVLVFAALVASNGIAQVPLNRTAEIPHPELAKEMLRLRLLEKQLDRLIESGQEDQDKLDSLIGAIEERYDKLHELQRKLQNELGQKEKGFVGSMRAERTQKAHEQLITAAKAEVEAAKRQFEKQRAVHQSQEEALLIRSKRMEAEMKKLQAELQKAHEELERARRARTESEPSQSRPVSVFKLKHLHAEEALMTLENVLGTVPRMSVAEHINSLLVQAKEEELKTIHSLLTEIDQPAEYGGDALKADGKSDLPESIMVRMFWLCDGKPSEGAKAALGPLPKTVCDALQKIGIDSPYLAAQGTTTVALQDSQGRYRADFQLENIPAELFGDHLFLNILGEVMPQGSEQLKISLHCSGTKKVGRNSTNINTFKSSVVTPLDHYVILGTNSYMASTNTTRSMGPMGEFGGEGGYGGYGGQKEQKQSVVSQFAYVVQVVAAETFEPTEETQKFEEIEE